MKMVKSLIVLFGLCIAGLAQADGHLMVDDAWIREAPPGAMALAGYMTLHNHAEKDRVLISAESPAFESVMLHRTIIDGDMSKMVHQHMINIPANGSLNFEPNSYHLMMMKPRQVMKAGDNISVTLRFKNGDSQEVPYQVRSAMGNMGEMNHGEHNSMGHDH